MSLRTLHESELSLYGTYQRLSSFFEACSFAHRVHLKGSWPEKAGEKAAAGDAAAWQLSKLFEHMKLYNDRHCDIIYTEFYNVLLHFFTDIYSYIYIYIEVCPRPLTVQNCPPS